MFTEEEPLHAALQRIPPGERVAWIKEVERLARLIEEYAMIGRKRRRVPATGRYAFTSEVELLCLAARAVDPVIVQREPHRAHPPSPHTLDRWLRLYKREGIAVFLRSVAMRPPDRTDHRHARLSRKAAEWINEHWREFRNPRHLYRRWREEAQLRNWTIPSESWLYRRWRDMPEIVKTYHLGGRGAYESKYAPFVQRDFTDLEALQVLCGDHSERDVTVLLKDGRLARPWLTLWFDLRTGLIWGWYLDLTPSSQTAGLAYANGVMIFGAQPVARPDQDFFSYIYTDRGRDYRSHHWDGKVINVHQQAMRLDSSGLELLRVERRVGMLDDLSVRHLLACGRNPKEKPVERVHRDISDWEQNTFAEFCGRDACHRPDAWRRLYALHEQFLKGMRPSSPFIGFDEYREAIAAFIEGYNSTAHERSTLCGARVIPIEEYRKLYMTRYEIAQKTLALLLLKSASRRIRKNGVQCFQRHWFYFDEKLSAFKGAEVEIRYTERDYGRVWVVLPNGEMCEARLMTPTSLLNPNQQTLRTVTQARAGERQLIHNFHLIAQSELRGETVEDRINQRIATKVCAVSSPKARVAQLTRTDHHRMRALLPAHQVTAQEVAAVEADYSIFDGAPRPTKIREFDGDD